MMMVGGVRQKKTAMQKWNETAMSGWMVVDVQQCQTGKGERITWEGDNITDDDKANRIWWNEAGWEYDTVRIP